MKMIDRTLMLTWRKALFAAVAWAALLLAHFAVDAVLGIDEPVLFLGAVLVVPIWAISAAVYTFDCVMIPSARGRRYPV